MEGHDHQWCHAWLYSMMIQSTLHIEVRTSYQSQKVANIRKLVHASYTIIKIYILANEKELVIIAKRQ